MKTQKTIELDSREHIPTTSIYTVTYANTGELGSRDVLLCIPGGPGNDFSLYDSPPHSIAEELFPHVDVILFDPRGCGKSKSSPTEFCDLLSYIDDIENIRKVFNIPADKLIIFGQSYGAIVALGYAIKYPENLKKLLLVGGARSSEFLKEAQKNLLTRGTPEQQKMGEIIWTGSFTDNPKEVSEFYRIMGPLYSYLCKLDAPASEISITYNVDILNYGFKKFLKEFDFTGELSKISCETLMLWGAEDWIFDVHQAHILHKEIKHSELKIYQQCSHMLWIDQWDRFFDDAVNFIKK